MSYAGFKQICLNICYIFVFISRQRKNMACKAESGPRQVCIPTMLKAPMLTMSASNPITQDIPTIFVGLVDNSYTDDNWNHDKQQIGRLFQITGLLMEIKVTMAGEFYNIPEFGNQMSVATGQINQLQIQAIRIVALGFATRSFVTEALAELVRSWQISAVNKELQFITLGDSEDCHCLNFCKDLCLEGRCKLLHYFNVSDYDIFGNLK
jgi:hypothetical protein